MIPPRQTDAVTAAQIAAGKKRSAEMDLNRAILKELADYNASHSKLSLAAYKAKNYKNAADSAAAVTKRIGVTPEAKKANLSKQTKATSGNVGYQNMLALQRANAARDRREQQSLTRFFTSMIYAWPPSIGVVVKRGRR